MSRTAFALVALITATMWIIPGRAQDQIPAVSLLKTGLLGLGAEPGFCSKEPLLQTPSVQKELKLTEEQIARLKRAMLEAGPIEERKGRENRQLQMRLTKAGDREGLAALEREGMKQVYTLTREGERPLLQLLDSHQRARLEQLQLQADGPMAFMRPEIQDRLKMSSEQVNVVKAICDLGRQAVAASATLPAGAKPIPRGLTFEKRAEMLKSKDFGEQVETVRQQVVVARNSTMREIAANLNKEQRATFEQMLGARFEFPRAMEKRDRGEKEARSKEPSGRDRSKDKQDR